MSRRWEPSPDVAPKIRDALAGGATIHDVALELGVVKRTLERAAARLPWLLEAIEEGRAGRLQGHGTVARYNRGCRCGECRRANAELGRRGLARRREGSIPANVAHGVASTYSNWGCRCAPCVAANTARHRARRAARRA